MEYEDLLCEEIFSMETRECGFAFYGSSPIIEEVGEGSHCMLLMAPISFYLLGSSFLVPTTKLNMNL